MKLSQASDHIILHLVDECIRWSTALEIPTKNVAGINEAIHIHWLKLYGKPDLMIWDGERAMVPTGTSIWASRKQLQLIQRAKHKKARVVERHNELLRNACHKSQTQLAAEGVEIKFAHILAEAVYSKNALLTIGDGGAFHCAFGTSPSPSVAD